MTYKRAATRLLMTLMAGGLVSAGILACGGDDDDTTQPPAKDAAAATDTGTVVQPASISGNVTYSGTQTGALFASAFSHFPPAATDVPAGVAEVPTAMWPGTNTFKITNLDPGTYYVVAYISVGSEHNMGPEAADPQSASFPMPITVTSGGSGTTNITLVDPATDGGTDSGPAPTDAGQDGGSRDGGDSGIADAAADG